MKNLFSRSTERASVSIAADATSLAHSNITILGPRDSVSRRSWAQEVASFDFGDFWKYRADFFFNTLLYCLNIGNLWRFPTHVMRFGEGAFIYVYLAITLIYGIPLMFFEFSVGQYTDRGVMHVFRIVPLLEGLSSAMGFFSSTVVHVYGLITVFNYIYFFTFVRSDAPLSDKTEYGKLCFYENRTNSLENLHYLNEVVMLSEESNCTFNERNMFLVFVMWLVIWLYTINEYATRPMHSIKIYTIIISALIVTLLASLTVKGAFGGILRLFSPPWSNFTDYQVYLRAFEQCLITLGLGMGPLINFGSRTFFRTPIHLHAIIVVLSTLVASLIMTLIVFSAVGVYSEELGYSDAVLSGQEYYMHVLLSKLFRKMLLGVKHLIIMVFYGAFLTAGFYSSAEDFFNNLRICIRFSFESYCVADRLYFTKDILLNGSPYVSYVEWSGNKQSRFDFTQVQYTKLMVELMRSKWDIYPEYYGGIILLFCICQSFISCGMISSHGFILLHWAAMDIFTTFSVLTLVFLETMSFLFLYGMKSFCDDIEFMVGFKPNLWFKICWYLSVLTCILVLAACFYDNASSFFGWYEGFSLLMYITVVVVPVIVPAIKTIAKLAKEGNISRIFYPREVETAFQAYTNWRDNLSNLS